MVMKRWCWGLNIGVGDEIVGWGDGDEEMGLGDVVWGDGDEEMVLGMK